MPLAGCRNKRRYSEILASSQGSRTWAALQYSELQNGKMGLLDQILDEPANVAAAFQQLKDF
jgi:hypothetical protein